MARRENFSSNIQITGSADFSNIISNLNKLYSTIEGKADRADVVNIEKSITKIKELQSEIQRMRDKGLTNEKDIFQYNKNIDSLLKTADQLSSKFSSIRMTGLEENIKDAKEQIKYLQKELNSTIKSTQTLVRAQVASTGKGYKTNLISAIEEGNETKRLEYEQKITQELQRQTDEAKKKMDLAQQDLDAAKNRLQSLKNQKQIEENTGYGRNNTSLTDFGLNRMHFRKNGNQFVSDDNFNTINQQFIRIINTEKTAEKAIKNFTKFLTEGDNNYTLLTNIETVINNIYNTASQRMEALKTEISEAEKTTKAANTALNGQRGARNNYEAALNAQRNTSDFLQSQEYLNGLKNITNVQQDLGRAAGEANQAERELNNTINALISGTSSLSNSTSQAREEQIRNAEATNQAAAAQRDYDNEIERIKYHVKYLLSITNAWRQVRNIVSQTFNDVSRLDKAFAEIAMVTNYSVSDMWNQYSNYAEMANRLGQSTESVIQASGLYYQQGLDTAEALELTEETMKLATLAGLDFKDATSQMTAALRAFHMEMDEGSHVTDVYAEVAANAAVDVQGLSDAMSATAAIANSSGMAFETTTAMLATMVEATQEAPKNLGTAMKAVLARFSELKENVDSSESEFEDLDYNKVDKALKTVGISIKDANGQFRDMDDVLLELGAKWDSLSRNSQRYIATIAAGSRQQSRFLALMENHQRTMELIEVATDSTGRANEQFAKYADTIEFKVNKIRTSWEELRVSLMNRGAFNGLLDIVDGALQRMKTMDIKDFGVLTAWALTVGKSLVNGIIEGISNGGNKLRGAIASAITKQKYSVELQAEIDSASRKNVKRLRQDVWDQQARVRGVASQLPMSNNPLQSYDGALRPQVEQLNQLYTERLSIINQIEQEKNKEVQNENQIEQLENRLANNEQQRLSVEEQIKQINIDESNTVINLNNLRNDSLNTLRQETEALREQNAQYERQKALLKTKRAQAYGTAIGQAATTAISMALTGSFKASEIAKSTLITSLTGAIGSALQGQGQLAIAQASIAAAALGAKILLEWYEKTQEKEKLRNDDVYRIKKQREELVKIQEEYNKKLDEANSKYNEAKEKWDSISKASEEYLELSSKGLLDEEETSSLEESIDTLTELVPELVEGYNAEGEAVLAVGDKYDNLISQYEKAEQQARALQKQAEATANALSLVDQYLSSQQDLAMAREYEAYAKEVQNGKTWNLDPERWPRDTIGLSLGFSSGPAGHFLLDSRKKLSYTDITLDEVLSEENYDTISGVVSNSLASDWIKAVFKDTSSSGEAQRQLIIDVLKDIEGVSGLSEKSTYEEIDAILDDGEKGSRIWRDFTEEYKKRLENIGKTVEELIEEAEATKAGITRQLPSLRASTLDAIVANLETEGMDETSLNYYKDFLSKQILTSDQLESIVEEAFSGNRTAEQAEKYVEDELKKLENSVAQNGVNEKYTKFFSNLTDTQKELIGTYYDNISQLSTSENRSAAVELIKALGIDDWQIREYFLRAAEGSKTNIEEMYQSFATNFDTAGRTVPKQLKSYFYQMGEESVAGFKDAIVNVSKDPEEQASLAESFTELIRRGFSPEALTTALNSIDWSSVTIFSEEDFLKILERDLSQFDLNGAELKQIYNAFSEPFLASGMESIDYSSAIDSLSTKYIDKLQKNGSDLAEYFEDNVESIALEGKELKQVQKALEETGASAEAFLDTTNGGTVFNVKAAREYYNAQTRNAEKLEKQLELDIQSGKLTEQEIKDKKEELNVLRQEEQVTRSILGLEQSIDTILSKRTEKISSSINAYKNMMSNFYSTGAIDSSSFTSWAESMLELDSSIDLNQFFNGTNFNTNAYQSYIKTQIADLESKKNLNLAQKEQLVNLRSLDWQLEEANTELQKQALEDNEIVKAQKEVEEAHKKVVDALNDIAKAEQDVIDKQNELNEVMYGSGNFKNQLEPMYNYSTLNQRYADLAARAKEVLDNPDIDDNTREALQDYLANNRKQLLNYLAQNEVYGAAAQADLTSLYEGLPQRLQGLNEKFGANYDTNVKQYFKIIDGVLTADIEALNRAALPDDIKNEIATLSESYNTNSDNILKNNDNIKKLLKEREEIHKVNLQAEVSIQEKVAEVLKEKYEEQVEDLKDKYDAMKEADNEYLEALQDSIDKQRKLRERENKWEDLAQKRKKLSLQQRDTSGANQLVNQKLEREIQKDEQSLLDSSIDDIVNNLKEFYELQDETRQDEVEYQEALKENTNWIAEANKIVLGLGTAEDFINWMKENSEDWQNMTAQQIELEEIELTEMFQKHQEYMEEQEEQILDSLNITEEEVQKVIDETSEALISESERSLNEITEKVDDSIETAKTALVDAMTALSEKQAAYLDALTEEEKKIGNLQIAYDIVNQYAEHLRDLLQEFSSASYEAYGRQAELEAMAAAERARSYIDAEQYGQHYSNSSSNEQTQEPVVETSIAQHEAEKGKARIVNTVDNILNSDSDQDGYTIDQSYGRDGHAIISREKIIGSGFSISQIVKELIRRKKYHGYYGDGTIYLGTDDEYVKRTAEGRAMTAFATGGLVNYTGPAWVDGTPTRPEAFLSADDTQNIAAMTNVLSSLRDLFDFTTYSQNSTINNTNRNDTVINVTVNVDNIADDYDVDSAIERIKQDIVDAASYAGSNVILNT